MRNTSFATNLVGKGGIWARRADCAASTRSNGLSCHIFEDFGFRVATAALTIERSFGASSSVTVLVVGTHSQKLGPRFRSISPAQIPSIWFAWRLVPTSGDCSAPEKHRTPVEDASAHQGTTFRLVRIRETVIRDPSLADSNNLCTFEWLIRSHQE
jgi:hypothetical protein